MVQEKISHSAVVMIAEFSSTVSELNLMRRQITSRGKQLQRARSVPAGRGGW